MTMSNATQVATINAKPLSRGYTIIDTITVGYDPKGRAELFGAFLGADRGYSSRIVRVSARTYDCVASDRRAVRFTKA